MNTSNFFLKNILSSLKLIVLFFLMNLAIFIGYFFLLGFAFKEENANPTLSMITDYRSGNLYKKEEIEKILKEKNCFYYVINPDGYIIDQMFIPPELNHPYSRAQVAETTKWFNNDYPVLAQIYDNGDILYLGFPKNSIARYNIWFSIKRFYMEIAFFPLLLIGNLLFFLYLAYSHLRKQEKALSPILTGITDLSQNKPVYLIPKGPLASINEALNTASEATKKREESRSQWISGISHDIRTPLMVIISSSEIISLKPEEAQILSERIKVNALRIRSLIESLNLRDRLLYGLSPARVKSFNLTSLITESATQFLNECGLDSTVLSLNIDPRMEKETIPADNELFERLLFNLLNNSVVHNQEKVQITISLRKTETEVILEIFDNGTGVNPKKLQGLNTENNKNAYQKHGLGLIIAKEIAKFHGFSLKFDSEPGRGFRNILTRPIEPSN